MLRVDFEKKHPMDGPLLAVLREVLERSRAEKFAVVVLSDYGKGFFSPESMLALREVLGSGPGAPLLLVDPKTSNYHLYHGVELLTPNRKEAAEAAELPPASTREEIISTGHKIFRKLGVKRLVITLGADGMAVFERPGKVWHVPNLARKIFDVTGAGDTVIATLALGLASGLELLEACILANHAAGIVVGKVGAATTSPKELREALASAPPLEAKLWLDV